MHDNGVMHHILFMRTVTDIFDLSIPEWKRDIIGVEDDDGRTERSKRTKRWTIRGLFRRSRSFFYSPNIHPNASARSFKLAPVGA